MELSLPTLRSLLRSPTVTETGHGRRLTLLAGLGLAGVLAAVVAIATLSSPAPRAAASQLPSHSALAPALPLVPGPGDPHHRRREHSSRSAGMSGPAAQVLALTNAQRVKHGCSPLHADSVLTRVAQRHSENMAEEHFFSHTDPSGRTFGKRQTSAGYSSEKTGGENIARGIPNAKTVVRGWMNSPPHRKNILNCRYTTIGVGYEAQGKYWTQEFGY